MEADILVIGGGFNKLHSLSYEITSAMQESLKARREEEEEQLGIAKEAYLNFMESNGYYREQAEEIIQQLISKAREIANNFIEGVKEAFERLWNTIKSLLVDKWNKLSESLKMMAEELEEFQTKFEETKNKEYIMRCEHIRRERVNSHYVNAITKSRRDVRINKYQLHCRSRCR